MGNPQRNFLILQNVKKGRTFRDYNTETKIINFVYNTDIRKVKISMKKHLDEKLLRDLYYEEGLSMKQISLKLGVGYNLVKRHFKEFNIKKRTASEQAFITMSSVKNRIELTCPYCGKDFEIKKSLLDRSEKHFCSINCSSSYYATRKSQTTKTGSFVKCFICDKEHYKPKNIIDKKTRYFCSKACLNVFNKNTVKRGKDNPRYSRIELNCSNCGKIIHKTPAAIQNNVKHHYCSRACMSNHYIGLVYGENHPSWRGGGDLYYGHDWKRISTQIIERDGFACKRCGIKQDELPKNWRLQVHHKKKLRDCKNLEEANNPSNLDTLCNRCHGIVEHHGIDY